MLKFIQYVHFHVNSFLQSCFSLVENRLQYCNQKIIQKFMNSHMKILP